MTAPTGAASVLPRRVAPEAVRDGREAIAARLHASTIPALTAAIFLLHGTGESGSERARALDSLHKVASDLRAVMHELAPR